MLQKVRELKQFVSATGERKRATECFTLPPLNAVPLIAVTDA